MWVLWLFKKDYPWKQVTIAGIIRCCPASVPYSLPLPPQVRQQGKKLGFFSPLQQHKVQSIYRNIGAEVISARTQQIYLYIQVHKTREVTTSSSWATRSFLFSPLLFFFFFLVLLNMAISFELFVLSWNIRFLTSAGSTVIWRKWEWTSACWQPVKRLLQKFITVESHLEKKVEN